MLSRMFLWLMMVLLPVCGWGQSTDRFEKLINSAPTAQPEQATSQMNQFISKLQAKRSRLKSDEAFLQYLFRESHKSFFHNYKAYSQFPEIFSSGNYDCLSATSFISVVLDEFGFEYKIIETNYHIFLMVEANQRQILLESTDGMNGFVRDKGVIQERLKRYHENKLYMSSSAGKYYYQYDLDLYQEVMPQQLIGLLYFNQAVSAFNENNLSGSTQLLKKAIRIYNSPRIVEFASILVSKIANSDLGQEQKKNLIIPFVSFIKGKDVVAAR